MAGDWDLHPSDTDVSADALRAVQPNSRLSWFHGQEHVRRVLADAREAELRAQPRFEAIPGGLEVSSENTSRYCLRHFPCGCSVVPRTGEVAKRCLQHYRDALFYRNRIKNARHATMTGTTWPVESTGR